MATTTNTTTNDSSSMRTPVTLSSGDLVSRLVAATPPYLYNVQLTPHSFFFSEMLRSYVQPKPEATTAAVSIANASASATISSNSIIKRRKRPWRDTRDRPLELTTKDKNLINHDLHNHSHHHHHPLNQQETYFHQELMENQLKTMQTFEGATRNFQSTMFDQKSNGFNNDVLKQLDENNSDFTKNSRNFFDDTSRFFSNEQISHHDTCERTFDEKLKVDHEINLVSEHRNKIDFPGRNSISGLMTGTRSEDMKHTTIKTCSLTGSNNNNNNNSNSNNNSSSNANNKNNNTRINDNDNDNNNNNNNNNSSSNKNNSNNSNNNYNKNAIGNNNSLSSNAEFIPSPLWYQPYPMAQSYPGIDPLHFFIDLRVSGHIWDRKLNERQLPFKGKHCSAFDVPQTREFNIRPLNLTRDEATTSRGSDKNYCGTHFILKNLTKTYKDIEKISKMETKSESHGNQNDSESTDEVTSKEEIRNSSPFSHNCHDEENTNGKDLRALIGLELVVDYVKEPKEEPNPRASPETLN